MTSSDVRDVLNLPDGLSGPRPSKKQKVGAPRPNLKGLAREVHMLSGDNPIAIIPEVTQFKKRRLASRKPASKWEMKGFRNSARTDQTLVLRHWRRKEERAELPPRASEAQPAEGQTEITQDSTEGPADTTNPEAKPEGIEDSMFAKFNAEVSTPQYTDDQYQQSLQNPGWTKEESDYLMGLVRDFDLRWPLIWDRYEWTPQATNGQATADSDESKAVVPAAQERSMEDLKARYYEIAAKMMAVQKPVQFMSQQEFQLHELMTHFNVAQEKARKEFASNSLHRSPEDAREEESLLLEIKRILGRSERFNEERRELYRRLDYPHSETDISTFKSSAGLQTLLQNLMLTVEKSKKRKSLMGADGVSPSGPAGPPNQQAAPEAGGASARRDSTAAASTGHRDSIGGAAQTPTAGNKKGQQAQQQPERRKLTEQEEAIYGVAHFDRLGSGPTFRTEKINKLFSHKSNQQALRINNALNELDVPARLAMPTSATTQQYESLLAAVNNMLDARKQADKLDADLKVEEAKRAEKEKQRNLQKGEDQKPGEQQQEKAKGEEASSEQPAASSGGDSKDTPKADGAAPGNTKQAQVKLEEPDNEAPGPKAETNEKDARPGSSNANHKRSASVLSSVSDKSSKRQKK